VTKSPFEYLGLYQLQAVERNDDGHGYKQPARLTLQFSGHIPHGDARRMCDNFRNDNPLNENELWMICDETSEYFVRQTEESTPPTIIDTKKYGES